MRGLARVSALFLLVTLTNPVGAADPGDDVWHFVEDGDRLYREDRSELTAAGIIQSDGRIARLYLVPGEDGAVVSVTLPIEQRLTALVSVLRMRNGAFSRAVEGDALLVSPAPNGGTTFSFAISKTDIELFMGARDWQLRIGEDRHTISLAGSRQAITDALNSVETGEGSSDN